MTLFLLAASVLLAAINAASSVSTVGQDLRKRNSLDRVDNMIPMCKAGHEMTEDLYDPCKPCSPGWFRSAKDNSGCKKCPPGEFSTVASAECLKCWPGSFAATSGSVLCQRCSKGSAATTEGSVSCTPCPAGSFAGHDGATACTECPEGTWSSLGSAQCNKCKAGHHSPAGSASCSPCPAGSFSDKDGSSECRKCPAGTQSASGASACTKCAAGRFSKEGSGQCTACPPGTFSDTVGASECQKCDASVDLAVKSAMTQCDRCPDSGISFGEQRCFRMVKSVKCNPSFPACERTIDNDVYTYGKSLNKAFAPADYPEDHGHFQYTFDTEIKTMKGYMVWGKFGCCKEEGKNFNVQFFPSGDYCESSSDFDKDKFYNVGVCKSHNVKSAKINHRYHAKVMHIAEVAFFAE